MFGTISEAVFNQKNADKLLGVFGVFPFFRFHSIDVRFCECNRANSGVPERESPALRCRIGQLSGHKLLRASRSG